ncbi:hypothetical protein [Lacticaseibacillus brantae]|nr:hypothetical protein [Lacticaseibacillus brantae]
MQKWITSIYAGAGFDASAKAKDDIAKIGVAAGYKPIHVFFYNDNGESDAAKISRIDGLTAGLNSGDMVVIQYPSWISHKFDTFFIDQMNKRGMKPVVFAHDVDSWRFESVKNDFDEIEYFNKAAVLVVHGPAMANRLREEGVTVPMVDYRLLDYLDDDHSWDKYEISIDTFQREIVLAGNLFKSNYLIDWPYDTPATALGVTNDELANRLNANPKVTYGGAYHQWDLINHLPRAFGLAWDINLEGKSYADYTNYNHPHKVSLYISHGMPVIVPKSSAVAPFIEANKLGFALNSLDEIDDIVLRTPDDVLADTLTHTAQMGRLLRDGWFTANALQQAERRILDNDFNPAGLTV